MSEQAYTEQQQQQAAQAQAAQPQQAQPASSSDSERTFDVRLVKRLTGERHWNVAKGIWETMTHAETGEPNSEYVLMATIDGIDVPLDTYNAGGLETIVRSQQQAQQTDEA